jgi:hypothetical protein
LNIDGICANTPAAKGRVERAHLTLQDRLVKELRLHGVSTIDAANAFMPVYMADYNSRFAKVPRKVHDAHRPVREDEDLTLISENQKLLPQEKRSVKCPTRRYPAPARLT